MIDLEAKQLQTVQQLLREYLPNYPVFAYGSRTQGRAQPFKPSLSRNSDFSRAKAAAPCGFDHQSFRERGSSSPRPHQPALRQRVRARCSCWP